MRSNSSAFLADYCYNYLLIYSLIDKIELI